MAPTCVDCGTPILLCDHAATRMTDPSLAFQAQMYEGKMEDLRLLTVQALHDKDAALARAEQAEARYERLRLACHWPVPEDGPVTISGYQCLLCGWDADPGIPESHEPSCLLYEAATATSAGE